MTPELNKGGLGVMWTPPTQQPERMNTATRWIKCPETDLPIPVDATEEHLQAAAVTIADHEVYCRACGQRHVWADSDLIENEDGAGAGVMRVVTEML